MKTWMPSLLAVIVLRVSNIRWSDVFQIRESAACRSCGKATELSGLAVCPRPRQVGVTANTGAPANRCLKPLRLGLFVTGSEDQRKGVLGCLSQRRFLGNPRHQLRGSRTHGCLESARPAPTCQAGPCRVAASHTGHSP